MEWLVITVVVGLGTGIAIMGVLALIVGAHARRRTQETFDGLARALEERRNLRRPGGGEGDGEPAPPPPEPEGEAPDPELQREIRGIGKFAKERPAEAASLIRLFTGEGER